jgi:hypothetical protein
VAYLVLMLAGVVWGFVLGRWWAVVGAIPVGLWISQVSEVDEVPPWFLGLVFAGVAVVGIGTGVLVRRARMH